MYLDQPGLMGLWDRMKAVFAPKSHTHRASDVSGVIQNGAELMTTNPFSPLPKMYISKIDNAFYAADKRFSVSGELIASDGTKKALSSSELGVLFDGSYESQVVIPAGSKLVLRMNFEDLPGNKFPDYPYGRIIVSFYYVCKPKSIAMKVYNNYEPQGVCWKDLTPINLNAMNRADTNAFAFYNGYYGAQEFELTVEGDGSNSYGCTSLTQIEMHLDRPYSGRNPFLSKYAAEELYYPLTAPKFIGDVQGNAYTATEIKAQAGVNASLEKLPTWTATPTDSTQLVRRDTANTATYGRVTFLTVWNYIKGKVDALYAPKASPAFTGNPTAPTPSFGDSSKSLATTEFVANAIKGASAPTDYIVAQGTCDFWTWRMWASGVAECWGSTGATYEDVTSEWGYLYEGSAHSNGFPGNTSESSALAFSVKLDGVTYTRLFKNVPEFCSCSFNPTGGAGISGIEIGGGLSALSTPTVYLLRPTPSRVDGQYSYYAKGRWR